MRAAASALLTASFTLFVPLVVAVWVPQRLIRVPSLSANAPVLVRSVGAALFVLGVIGHL